MVVESLNAHDDYDNDCIGNDSRAAKISQAISWPRNTCDLYGRVLSLDTYNLFQKRRLGISRDGSADTAIADGIHLGDVNGLHDPVLCRGGAEQLSLG